ncbi:MAG TPA: anti-sigma factor [Phnomibacter sp.]|nr:anti-sigma factor [Phnomibacter sp.]
MNIREYISSGIVEAFVLGLASEDEVREVMPLRQQFPELDEAIIQFENSLEQQAIQDQIIPPSRVKENLLAELEDSFTAPVRSMDAEPSRLPETLTEPAVGQKPATWLRYAAAAILVAFLANAVLTIWIYGRYKTLTREYASLQAESKREKVRINSLYADIYRMQDTKLKVIKMEGVPGREGNYATVYWDEETGEVFLFKNKLPETASNKQYQLWAIVDGKPVNAGVIEADCEGLCKQFTINDKVQAFAITLERSGGSPEPTLAEMMVMGGT